jgi:hypothetical protein
VELPDQIDGEREIATESIGKQPVAGAGLEPREVTFACAVWFCMIAAYAALQVAAPFAASAAFRTRYLGADFTEFYIAGQILNQHGANALYDLDLQTRLFHQLDPGNHDAELWYVCAPYLAQVFRPFALLSFRTAYIAWMIVAILTYGIGVGALSPYLAGLPNPYRRAALLLGLTFVPVAALTATREVLPVGEIGAGVKVRLANLSCCGFKRAITSARLPTKSSHRRRAPA